ncbi:LysM domain/BON superfamily protein [Poriferisphaera corsica]|uniref:LysM domain/BON superfamily protein n=1 Tax=Poriferisphaera corsica TaxID=2528020 RepID=A0A517YSD7_9BACT|nr:LysM peptidoglycan-binding domain-containing protein [Poriferisphaera corsica]QDU33128.1 LysM domain/BON superfamily protein [Poriferisphaera corsica]
MTRETKVGLLFGVAVVMLIGIIAADHLASTKNTPSADANVLEYVDRAADESRMSRRQAPSLNNPNTNPAPQPLRRALPSPNTLPPRTTTPQRPQFVRAMATDTNTDQNNTTPPATRRNNTSSRAAALLNRAAQNTTPQNQSPTRPLTSYERSVQNDQDRTAAQQPTTPAARRPSIFDRPTSTTNRPPANRIIGTAIPTTPSTSITPGNRDARIHIVKPNESLYGIALKYYGNGDKWNLIKNANPTRVSDNGSIIAGAKLTIPFDPKLLKELETNTQTSTASATRTPTQSSNEITVKPGDTLSELSLRYLGSSKHWKKILAHNNMKDASELRAGMKLKLPTLDNTPAPSTQQTSSATRATTPRNTQPTSSSKTYTVRSGDSLIRIAKRELGDGSRWQEIFDLNKATLKSPDAIKVGQTLKLP